MRTPLVSFLCALCLIGSAGCRFEPTGFGTSGRSDTAALDSTHLDATRSETGAGDTRKDVATPVADMAARMDTAAADTAPDLDAAPLDAGPDADMDSSERLCGAELVDTSSDARHCGGCDQACDPLFGVCQASACACINRLDSCPGAGCVDTRYDANHCGTCGRVCGPGEICDQGNCRCRSGTRRCGTLCVDVRRDPRHCGGCNIACNGSACRSGSCRSGSGCGVGFWGCSTDGGVACLQDSRSSLFCGAEFLGDGCGDVCLGSELCTRFDVFDSRTCHPHRPGRGCTGCPCTDCGNDECLQFSDFPGVAFCVAD